MEFSFRSDIVEEDHGGRNDRRRGRNGQAVEDLAFDDADLNVVPRESQSAAQHKQKCDHPAPLAVNGERPAVSQKPTSQY